MTAYLLQRGGLVSRGAAWGGLSEWRVMEGQQGGEFEGDIEEKKRRRVLPSSEVGGVTRGSISQPPLDRPRWVCWRACRNSGDMARG